MADPTATNLFGVPLDQNNLNTLRQSMGPSSPKEQLRTFMSSQPQQSHSYEEKSGKHKGVAGTARSVLGFLGDFLLKKIGMPAMYGPGEEERKLNAAWEGHEQDPQAAIDRVTDVNYTEGQKLRNSESDNERLRAQQKSTAELRDARIQASQEAGLQKARVYAASGINSTNGWTPEKLTRDWSALRNQMISAGKRQGYDLSDDIPETADPVAINGFLDANVGLGTQRAQWLTERRDDRTYEMAGKRDQTTRRGQDLSHEDRQAAEAGRTDRNELNEGGRNDRNTRNERGRNERSSSLERGRNTRFENKPPAQGKIVTLPDGRKVKIKG